jgi:hypothetical protein
MTYLEYLLTNKSLENVKAVMRILAPGISEDHYWGILAECSNWEIEDFQNIGESGMTICADRKSEKNFRSSFMGVPRGLDGLMGIAYQKKLKSSDPSLIDILIAGLSLIDSGSDISDLFGSDIKERARRMLQDVTPARSIVASSLEELFVISPGNQTEIMGSVDKEYSSDRWLCVKGSLPQNVLRRMWHARENGLCILHASGFEVFESKSRDETMNLCEEDIPVFYRRKDYYDLSGADKPYLGMIFLKDMLGWSRGSDYAIRDEGSIVDVADLPDLKPGDDEAARQRFIASSFLSIVLKAAQKEGMFHFPGSLASSLRSGSDVPELFGVELTN